MQLSDSKYDVFDVPIFRIWINEDFNRRGQISRESVEELARSIGQEGLLFPVVLQPIEEVEDSPRGFDYRLVAGFRRLTACKNLLRWETIPANIRTGLTERQASLLNLTENLERKDLNVLEEALALESLFPDYRSNTSIAKELKKSEQWVSIRRTLLLLSPWIQKAVASERFSKTDLRVIQAALDPDEKAKEILKAAKEGRKSSVVQIGRRARKKAVVKEKIADLLGEGFSPYLLRLMGWCIGEVDDEGLKESLIWLRDRKGWLK